MTLRAKIPWGGGGVGGKKTAQLFSPALIMLPVVCYEVLHSVETQE